MLVSLFSCITMEGKKMNNETLETEELLENEILTKLDLIDFDIERTFYNVCKFMRDYKKLKCKSYDQPPIKITTKYKYIFVDEKTKGINDYTKLDQYIDNDTEYRRLSKIIVCVTENMSPEELVYYTVCIFQGKAEYRCAKEIGCSSCGLIPIKNSCIVKFACAFDIEIYKNIGFADPKDEEEYQKFLNTI